MNPKFKANGVFASTVDYFCLVCESRLYNETDAVSHIGKPVHTKNFELTNYFGNREDHVRKIKKWYFCELCNLLLSTATKVRLHVTEVEHIEYKNERLLERNGKFVVAFSNVQIHDKAWNGIIEETCVICNTEFDDEKIHINETMHIIKLIQDKTEVDEKKNLYRKTDNSSIQCLTCNIVVALNSLDAHFNLPEHIKLYQEAINSIQDTTLENDKKANNAKDCNVNKLIQDTVLQNDKKVNSAKDENLNEKPKQDKILQNDKKTNNANDVNVNNKVIQDTILQNYKKANNVNHKQNKEPEKEVPSLSTETNVNNSVDGECRKKNYKAIKKSDKEICEILDTKDYVTKHKKDLWCILCHWELDPTTVKDHVNDLHHQTMLKLHKKRLSKLNADQITLLEENNEIGQAGNTNIQNSAESIGILDSVEFFSENGIQINNKVQTAFCVKCSSSLNFNKAFIENHIKEHTENLKADVKIKKDNETTKHNFEENESILDSIEIFQQNNIQINFEIQTAFCKKCGTLLDFKKNCIENHIEEHNKPENKIGQANSIIELNNDEVNSIKESINNFLKNDVVINFELQTAHCKKCSTSLDYNKAFIENHIKVHANICMPEKKKSTVAQVTPVNENRKAKNTTNKKALKAPAAKKIIQQRQSSSYSEEDIKKIAEENDMSYKPNSKKVHCNRCNTKIPCFPQNLHEHVEGSAHKAKVCNPDPSINKNKSISKETINKFNHDKVPLVSFITSFVTINGVLHNDIVINNRICISVFSFGLVRQAGNMFICEICKIFENINQFGQHFYSVKHKEHVDDSLVVDVDEFIREVPQTGFHCGYCDIFQSSWESMESHLQSYDHRDSKSSSQWRLQQYLPHIEKHHFDNGECFGFHMVFSGNNED